MARQHGIPVQLLRGLVKQESGFNPRAVSSAGAQGLTQLMPATARGLGVTNPFDPTENLQGGAKYLRQQYDRFGDWKLALAAYNAGPGAVQKYGGVPPYAQTQGYVRNILGGLGQLPAAAPARRVTAAAGQSPVPAGPDLGGLASALISSNNTLVGLPALPPIDLGPPTAPVPAPVFPKPLRQTGKGTTYKGGRTISFLEHFAAPYGVQVTSTTTGNHVNGSYHYKGRAVDFGGPSNKLAALIEAALQHPQDFTEAFFTGPGNPGYYIKNGRVYPNSQLDKSVAANHHDHVHLAK